MSRNKTARDNLDFISFSSEHLLFDRLRISLARFYQHLSLKMVTKQSLIEQGRRLVSLAEDARCLRQWDVLRETSEMLTAIPLRQFESIGSHYKAYCLKFGGLTEEARALFEIIAGDVPPSYRARTIQSLGMTYFDKGDYATAHKLFTEASHLACRNEYANPMAFLQSQWWLGILQSIDGDHESSLSRFEGLRPLVELAASRHPVMWFDCQNSLAVELMGLGRMEEAERASRIALASPFARVFPEWHETARDIAAKTQCASHSVIAINSALSEPDAHSDAASNSVEASNASEPLRQPPELCNLTLAQRLYLFKQTGRALGIDDQILDQMMISTGVAHIDSQCCGHSHHLHPSADLTQHPEPLNLETESDLEVLIRLWSNEEVSHALFAATFMALDSCKDRFRLDHIVDRIARLAFYESPECFQLQEEWLDKVENLIDLESPGLLEEKISRWFDEEGIPAEIAAVTLSWYRRKDGAHRSNFTRRLVTIAFLASPDSEDMEEEEWRRKVKAMVKPIGE